MSGVPQFAERMAATPIRTALVDELASSYRTLAGGCATSREYVGALTLALLVELREAAKVDPEIAASYWATVEHCVRNAKVVP